MPSGEEPLSGPENYISWCQRVKWLFKSNKVNHYVNGNIPCPDPHQHPTSGANWEQNNALACLLITRNIASSQLKHTNPCQTSHEMWKALKSVHESHGHTTVVNLLIQRTKTNAEEGDNIPKHVDKLKETWERINALASKHLHILDGLFKVLISISLPRSWDNFTKKYIGDPEEEGTVVPDSKQLTSLQQFIGTIIFEYGHRLLRPGAIESTNVAYRASQRKPKLPLLQRISQAKEVCQLCQKENHCTHDCPQWSDPICDYCHKPRHNEDSCWNKNKALKDKASTSNKQLIPHKCVQPKQTHQAKHEQEEMAPDAGNHATSSAQEFADDPTAQDEIQETYTYKDKDAAGNKLVYADEDLEDAVSLREDQMQEFYYGANVVNNNVNNNGPSNYAWIADCTTTSHICNNRNIFHNYTLINDSVPIFGVGNLTTCAQGKGTIILQARHGGKTHTLTLHNVLHIPFN
jgi:hypothetical protein